MTPSVKRYLESKIKRSRAERACRLAGGSADAVKIAGRRAANAVWRDWAKARRKDLQVLQSKGFILRERSPKESRQDWYNSHSTQIRAWIDNTYIDFSNHDFYSADFSGIKLPFETSFYGSTLYGATSFTSTKFVGDANFQRAHFLREADFRYCAFFREAAFMRTTYEEDATFYGAKFGIRRHSACFEEAIFTRDANFTQVTFGGKIDFLDTRFHERADFLRARFEADADFFETSFHGFAGFRETVFKCEARFIAISVKRGFDLNEARFTFEPDFIQAHFNEAPRLDAIKITNSNFFSMLAYWFRSSLRDPRYHKTPIRGRLARLIGAAWRRRKKRIQYALLMASRYRAIKRLAAQNQDAEQERNSFRGELCFIKRTHIILDWRRIFNYIYFISSHYGRSFYLPVIWLSLIFIASTAYYVEEHLHYGSYQKEQSQEVRGDRRTIFPRLSNTAWFLFLEPGGRFRSSNTRTEQTHLLMTSSRSSLPHPRKRKCRRHCLAKPVATTASPSLKKLTCLTGGNEKIADTTVLGAALHIAFTNSTGGFFGSGQSEKLKQSYACLYGLNKHFEQLHKQELIPLIPDRVASIGMLQTVLSLPLLFLAIQTLRNHFRISS